MLLLKGRACPHWQDNLISLNYLRKLKNPEIFGGLLISGQKKLPKIQGF
jgi:hypothetical protein